MEPLQPELIGPGSGQKICAACGVMKPKTAFYFQKDASTDDGWCPKCKQCRNEFKKQQKNREIDKNISKLQLNLLERVANGQGRKAIPDLESGGEIILEAFGGIEGLAQKLAMDYECSPLGTAGRTKILLGALQFVAKAMEQRPSIKVEAMDEETLKAALKDALGSDYERLTDESESSTVEGSE